MKKHIILFLTVLSFLLASCSNLVDSEAKNAAMEGNTQKAHYVTVTGSALLDGAFPEEIISLSRQSAARSAFPAKPAVTAYDLYITAKNTAAGSTEQYTNTILEADNNGTYTVQIPVAETTKNYKIEVVAKNASTGAEVLKGQSEAFDISSDEPVAIKNINMSAISDEGQGTFNLEVDVSGTDINCGAMIIKQMYDGTLQEISHSASVASGKITFVNIVSTDSGSYSANFKFFKDTQELYSFTQTVNVYSGLVTRKWVKNGVEPYLNVSGSTIVCKITSELTSDYALTQIYVDDSCTTTNPPESGKTYTNGSGTYLNPVTSFEAAIAKIRNSSKDYTIHVKGSFQGCFELPADLDTRMNSLTIVGESPLVNGQPQDKLYGYRNLIGDDTIVNVSEIKNLPNYSNWDNDGKIGSVLTVNTNKTVTLENIEISNGVTASTGGGLNIKAGTVILKSGVLVQQNLAYSYGGGINVDNSTLYMLGGKVTNNFVASVFSSRMGGGVHVKNSSKFVLSGGVISDNASLFGGGVMLNASNASQKSAFIMTGGEICNNQAGRNSGGVGALNCDFEMRGGSIHNNEALSSLITGAVSIEETGSFSMTGGEIKDNTGERAVCIDSKASIKIGGTAYIPAGESNASNVCLKHSSSNGIDYDAKITLVGGLSRHSAEDPLVIVPGRYTRGLHIAEADDVNVTDATAYKTCFKVPDEAWDIFVSSDKKSITINSPIYIASPTDEPGYCDKKGDNVNGTGEKKSPYATFARACNDLTDDTVEYIILIDGKITGANVLSGNAKTVSISGVNGIDHYKEEGYAGPTDSLDGGGTGRALTIDIEKEVFIANLKIQNGNANGDGEDDKKGGGILVPSGATLTVNEGTLITGNTAGFGGGIYNGGTLYIKGGVIAGNTAAVFENEDHAQNGGDGGGVYNNATATLENAAVIGTKYDASGAEPAHDIATSANKSNVAQGYGGGVFNTTYGTFTMDASLTESAGGVYYNYSNNVGGIENFGTLTLNGGVIAYNKGTKVGAIDHGGKKLTVNGATIAFNAAETAGTGANKASGGITIIRNSSDLTAETEWKAATFKNNVDGNTDSSKGIGIYVGTLDSSCPTVKLTGGTFATNTVVYLEDNCYLRASSSYSSSKIIFELQNYTEARTLVSPLDGTVSDWTSSRLMNDDMEMYYSWQSSSSSYIVALYKIDRVTADKAPASITSSAQMDMEGSGSYQYQIERSLKARFGGNFYIKTSDGKYGVMRFTNPGDYINRITIKYSMFDWDDRTPQSASVGTGGRDLDGDGKTDFYIYYQTTGNISFDKYYFATQNGARYLRKY